MGQMPLQARPPAPALIGSWLRDWGGWLTLGAAAFTALHLLWLGYQWGEQYHSLIAGFANLPPSLIAMLLAARAGLFPSLDQGTRRAWLVIAIANAAYFCGNVIFYYYDLTTESPPFPSAADAFYLLSYPILLIGVWLFPADHDDGYDRTTFWLDAGIVFLGGGAIIWHLVLQPTASFEYDAWLTAALSIAYPAADLVLLVGAATVALRGSTAASRIPLLLLLVSFLLTTITDIVYGAQSIEGTYTSGSWVDGGWTLALLAVIFAAQYQISAGSQGSGPATRRWSRGLRAALPLASLALGLGLLLYAARAVLAEPLGQVIVIICGLVALVAVRQLQSSRTLLQARREAEQAQAAAERSGAALARANSELEERVAERTTSLAAALEAQAAQARDLEQSLQTQAQLNQTIIQLSAPIIPVSDDVLVVPLVGVISDERVGQIMRLLLAEVQARRARRIFLDITGVALLDAPAALALTQVASALRLLGAETVLVGVRPEVAEALVSTGADLGHLRSAASLQAGLREHNARP